MHKTGTHGKVKYPCRHCLKTVNDKTGIACKGACKKRIHYDCLNLSPNKIQEIKNGNIKVTCPCPNCDDGIFVTNCGMINCDSQVAHFNAVPKHSALRKPSKNSQHKRKGGPKPVSSKGSWWVRSKSLLKFQQNEKKKCEWRKIKPDKPNSLSKLRNLIARPNSSSTSNRSRLCWSSNSSNNSAQKLKNVCISFFGKGTTTGESLSKTEKNSDEILAKPSRNKLDSLNIKRMRCPNCKTVLEFETAQRMRYHKMIQYPPGVIHCKDVADPFTPCFEYGNKNGGYYDTPKYSNNKPCPKCQSKLCEDTNPKDCLARKLLKEYLDPPVSHRHQCGAPHNTSLNVEQENWPADHGNLQSIGVQPSDTPLSYVASMSAMERAGFTSTMVGRDLLDAGTQNSTMIGYEECNKQSCTSEHKIHTNTKDAGNTESRTQANCEDPQKQEVTSCESPDVAPILMWCPVDNSASVSDGSENLLKPACEKSSNENTKKQDNDYDEFGFRSVQLGKDYAESGTQDICSEDIFVTYNVSPPQSPIPSVSSKENKFPNTTTTSASASQLGHICYCDYNNKK